MPSTEEERLRGVLRKVKRVASYKDSPAKTPKEVKRRSDEIRRIVSGAGS